MNFAGETAIDPLVFIKKQVMDFITSETRRSISHLHGRLTRRGNPVVYYFHQVDDPYSHITEQKLDELKEQYTVDFVRHDVSMPDAVFQGDEGRFRNWALQDAKNIAAFYK